MPLYTRAQLAKHCGKARGQISTAIKAGNIIVSEDGIHIDSEHLINKPLIEKWVSTPKRRYKTSVSKNKIKPDPKKPKKNAPKIDHNPEADAEMERRLDLNDQKLLAEIEYKKEQVRGSELKNAALRGKSIPTDMVSEIVSSLGTSFQNSYKDGAESLLMQFTHKNKTPSKEVAVLREKLIDLINSSHRKAISTAKAALRNAIDKNSNTVEKELFND